MKQIKIGSRRSALAMWQAHQVASKIQELGFETEIIQIVSGGDKNLKQPLYSMGVTGIFTKDLDVALLNKEIDLGVHSLKDMPTLLPTGIRLAAVLKRDFSEDVLIRNQASKAKDLSELSIATSSLRRKAFWKNKYPDTVFCDIRGNVETRIRKINEGLADATLLSLAGIKRMDMSVDYEHVPFLLQAPSQGVVACTALNENRELIEVLRQINDSETEKCILIERDFLREMEGGCTAPIGAKATLKGDTIHFEGRVVSLDGKKRVDLSETKAWKESLGIHFAQEVLKRGGREIMAEIKKSI